MGWVGSAGSSCLVPVLGVVRVNRGQESEIPSIKEVVRGRVCSVLAGLPLKGKLTGGSCLLLSRVQPLQGQEAPGVKVS